MTCEAVASPAADSFFKYTEKNGDFQNVLCYLLDLLPYCTMESCFISSL